MSTVPDLATLDELLEHAGWTRALAVRLLGDADDADDVVQETWLSALRVPPQRRHALRPWLATVVRNLARSHGRRRLRSRSREQHAAEHARLHSVPSSEELLSQLETERTLAALVLDLPEPYRHTVILRYHHGKSAADIARAEDIPEGTVRWRLKYGLDQLRQNFEERAGGRDVARGILIPFAAAASAVTLGKAALAAPVVALSLTASSKAMVAATVALVAVSGTAVGTAVVKHHRATVRKAGVTAQLSPGMARGVRPEARRGGLEQRGAGGAAHLEHRAGHGAVHRRAAAGAAFPSQPPAGHRDPGDQPRAAREDHPLADQGPDLAADQRAPRQRGEPRARGRARSFPVVLPPRPGGGRLRGGPRLPARPLRRHRRAVPALRPGTRGLLHQRHLRPVRLGRSEAYRASGVCRPGADRVGGGGLRPPEPERGSEPFRVPSQNSGSGPWAWAASPNLPSGGVQPSLGAIDENTSLLARPM